MRIRSFQTKDSEDEQSNPPEHRTRFFTKENTMYKNITKIALRAIALAMGVAVIVLGTLQTLDITSGVAMPGLGLAALAVASFQE
jgi:hypothetical protein